jgi:hypothetical protein
MKLTIFFPMRTISVLEATKLHVHAPGHLQRTVFLSSCQPFLCSVWRHPQFDEYPPQPVCLETNKVTVIHHTRFIMVNLVPLPIVDTHDL